MYCCTCGAKIYEGAGYCHKCGAVLPEEAGDVDSAARVVSRSHPPIGTAEEEQNLVRELLSTNSKREECHKCGKRGRLYAWDFGLGKVLGVNREWGETALSVALSAVTLPLIGLGALRLPGKKTSLNVLRLRLLLCESCRQDGPNYSLHPWWNGAARLGYTEFLCPGDLSKLQPFR